MTGNRIVLFAFVFGFTLLAACARPTGASVYFADPGLKAAVEAELGITNPTASDVGSLTSLNAAGREIRDLTGLEYGVSLQALLLYSNQIQDLSPLAGLTDLQSLDLSRNQIRDTSSLRGLTGLQYLDLDYNQIQDLSPLASLTSLRRLDLDYNKIRDLSPLAALSLLEDLSLYYNQIRELGPLSGLTDLQQLALSYNKIGDLSPLSSLTQLMRLDLSDNVIGQIDALSSLVQLQQLDLTNNRVSGLAPLAGLDAMRSLCLGSNLISDLSYLAQLTNLQTLLVGYNQVSDLSGLLGLTSLQTLDLRGDPLDKVACEVQIPQILADNPRLSLQQDACGGGGGTSSFTLTVSASAGGSVLQPGLGTSSRSPGEVVLLWAQAQPMYAFSHWSGSMYGTTNPTVITMNRDYEIRANFVSGLKTLIVDDNAPGDPKPQDPNSSDPAENGSPEHPFDRIQDAIDVAAKGASIVIRPGTYRENLNLLGKSISLMGMDPNDPSRPAYPVIAAANPGAVLRFDSGEDPNCLVQGLVITQGQGRTAGAVYCRSASPTISHCLIIGNRTSDPKGATVCCIDSRAQLLHCTLADNVAGPQGGAVSVAGGQVVLSHCILWANTPAGIVTAGSPGLFVTYCDLQSPWPGPGNGSVDPLFAASGYWSDPTNPAIVLGPDRSDAVWVAGDYHLKSKAGRWNPQIRLWQQDNQTSPCIDAGLPSAPVGYESMPNGARINLGAYGGTSQASKTWLP